MPKWKQSISKVCYSMVVKSPAVHILLSWLITIHRLLPMICDSNPQPRRMELQGLLEQFGGGGGGGGSVFQVSPEVSELFIDWPNIYTMSSFQTLPLEALLQYLCEWPGSTNLDKNMAKLSIGWS